MVKTPTLFKFFKKSITNFVACGCSINNAVCGYILYDSSSHTYKQTSQNVKLAKI